MNCIINIMHLIIIYYSKIVLCFYMFLDGCK